MCQLQCKQASPQLIVFFTLALFKFGKLYKVYQYYVRTMPMHLQAYRELRVIARPCQVVLHAVEQQPKMYLVMITRSSRCFISLKDVHHNSINYTTCVPVRIHT